MASGRAGGTTAVRPVLRWSLSGLGEGEAASAGATSKSSTPSSRVSKITLAVFGSCRSRRLTPAARKNSFHSGGSSLSCEAELRVRLSSPSRRVSSGALASACRLRRMAATTSTPATPATHAARTSAPLSFGGAANSSLMEARTASSFPGLPPSFRSSASLIVVATTTEGGGVVTTTVIECLARAGEGAAGCSFPLRTPHLFHFAQEGSLVEHHARTLNFGSCGIHD